VARWAIGDIQGCDDELGELLDRIGFSADRDRLHFVGDLVNRGPRSLAVLRRVRALADNAVVVLGNHDLHLLASALVGEKLRRSDTLDEILAAADREALLEWLLHRPLLHRDPGSGDLLVHAGLVPQWTVPEAQQLAQAVEQMLRGDAPRLLRRMYGDEPSIWDPALRGIDRRRFTINVLTRLRFCTAKGAVEFKHKGALAETAPPLMPWFRVPGRASLNTRIVFGHWSALGFYRGDNVICLDTGCMWGGALTALDLDAPDRPPISVASRQPRSTGE
jgi:bis(5'-nucleosyl)-tetraphosphatase (symmetrical)